MKKLLEDLWYSYIQEEDEADSEEARAVLKAPVETEEKLNSELNENQRETLENFSRLYSELYCIYEREAFVKGVKFATKYLIESAR